MKKTSSQKSGLTVPLRVSNRTLACFSEHHGNLNRFLIIIFKLIFFSFCNFNGSRITSGIIQTDLHKALFLLFHMYGSDIQNLFLFGSRAGNSLIRSSLICSFTHFAKIKWATESDSLRSLKTNEWPWANRSGRSEEMSDCDWIDQVAQDKWATVSEWAIFSTNFG